MIRTAFLAAALGTLALPAAAVTVSATASLDLTASEIPDGIEVVLDADSDVFEDAIGNAAASADLSFPGGPDAAGYDAVTGASASPIGDAFADAAVFDFYTITDAAGLGGSVTIDVAWDLATDVSDVGPGELGAAFAAFGIYELLEDGSEAVIAEVLAASGDGTLTGLDLPGVPATGAGARSITLEFDPFGSRAFYVDVAAFSVALSEVAPIPVPAGGWLLLAGLGGLALRRRR